MRLYVRLKTSPAPLTPVRLSWLILKTKEQLPVKK
nr:MAG TPA: hypothetical protein [Caudoviricetes sp.]